ncbi:MAG: hypothetical protein HOV94_06675 [Saccharothrix sp.]|nr:hypothetical protein [Saccharothrix sp.]
MGLILGLAGGASAHSTDDWSYWENTAGFGYVGYSSSHVSGVYQRLDMWRYNNFMVLKGYASDTSTDGYCATIQITYETYDYTAGRWSGHWHTRDFGMADCGTGGTGDGVTYAYARSTYQFRNMYSRACHADSSANIIHCESTWHGPI